MTTYYNILDTIKNQLLQDPFCNSVTEGSIYEIDLSKQTMCPYAHIQVNNASITERTNVFNISIFCMDIVDKNPKETTNEFRGNDNEQDVLNTQYAVGTRLLELMRRGDLRTNNFALLEGSTPSMESFTERFENFWAGWVVTIDVEVPNEMTICDVVSDGGGCEEATYIIKDKAGNVLYSGTIVSGGSLDQTITNSIVSNSDDSYTSNVLSQASLELPDVTFTVNNTLGNSVETEATPSAIDKTLVAPDGTAVVQYVNGTAISTSTVASGATRTISVPNPIVCNDEQIFLDMYTGKAALLESGIAESNSCLTLTDVFTASPIGKIQPSAYGVGKLVAMKPLIGGFDLSVVRGTTATRYNSSSLIENVAVDVPRLDYFGVSCPSVLVEGQATNLFLQSEDLNDSFWTGGQSRITVTSDAVASPISGVLADTFTSDTANGTHIQSKGRTGLTSGGSYSFSGFFKKNGYDLFVTLRANNNSNKISFVVDLDSGGISAFTEVGAATGTASVEAYPNDWYRVIANVNLITGATSVTSQLYMWDGSSESFTGDGVSGYHITGLQFEETKATSYIPTTTTTVTRNADVMSVTGLSGITTLTETFEDDTTNIISTPTSYTMSEGRIKKVTTV